MNTDNQTAKDVITCIAIVVIFFCIVGLVGMYLMIKQNQ